jgi:mannose-1-phosphate guanylyltransferase
MKKNYYVVIMSGGVGSRFWPLSKQDYPKQFHDILGTGKTLIQQTVERFKDICPEENIFFVTNEKYRDLIKEQVPSVKDENILGEPSARNTAPCIAYAAHRIKKENPDAVMVVAPSDHIINNRTGEFTKTILHALDAAEHNEILVTLGITPTRPDTGYGYIQFKEDGKIDHLCPVKTFTEKPNLEIAKHFVETGEFLWNAGIFVMSISSILKAYKRFLPDIHDVFSKGEAVYGTINEKYFIRKTYEMCTMISIDYGIMEKAENVYVIPAQFEWNDVGTWNAVYEMVQKDENGNVTRGDNLFLRKTKNSIIYMPGDKLAAVNGVENLIIVESDNILLIADRTQEQEVRLLVNELKLKYGEKFL